MMGFDLCDDIAGSRDLEVSSLEVRERVEEEVEEEARVGGKALELKSLVLLDALVCSSLTFLVRSSVTDLKPLKKLDLRSRQRRKEKK